MSSERQRTEMAMPQTSAVDSEYDASGKSVQEIESDIGETRAKLGAILHQIEREIAPQHLLQRAIDSLKNGVNGGMGGGLSGSLRDNPTALILMGVGLGWFALSAARSRRLGDHGGAMPARISRAADGASDQAALSGAAAPKKVSASEAPVASPVDYAFAREKPGDATEEKQHIAAGMSEVGKDELLGEARSSQPQATSSEGSGS